MEATYKIGELSKILDVSNETIRNYEEKGLITSIREKNNNYRLYSTWDVFTLVDANIYRKFNFSIQETINSLNAESYSESCSLLNKKISELEEEIYKKQLLLEWMKWWTANMESCMLNINNVQLKKMPEMYFKQVGTKNSGDDISDFLSFNNDIAKQTKMAPYCIPAFHVRTSDMRKNIKMQVSRGGLIQKKYSDSLNLDVKEKCTHIKEQIYLSCTVNMGNIGELTWETFQPLIKYVNTHDVVCGNNIYGWIISRFQNDGVYKRYLEILLPTKKKL